MIWWIYNVLVKKTTLYHHNFLLAHHVMLCFLLDGHCCSEAVCGMHDLRF